MLIGGHTIDVVVALSLCNPWRVVIGYSVFDKKKIPTNALKIYISQTR